MKKIIPILLLLSSCASPLKYSEPVVRTKPVIYKDASPIEQDTVRVIESKTKAPKTSKRKPPKFTDLELKYPKKLFEFWIKYFTKRERARFERHLNNAVLYKDEVQSILKEMNVPEDLFYVGLIESGYNMKARSHANAVGPWQFISGTGKRYGLRIDSSVDERRNIYKATRSAARYFRDLYNIFGSWNLALCAYNAGEYRIIRAIRKGKTRDYLKLVKMKLLPKETIYYIPKLAAAKYLLTHSNKYAFNIKNHSLDKRYHVNIKRNFKVSYISSKLGISASHLREMNPDLKRDYIRVGRKGLDLFLDKKYFERSGVISNFLVKPKNSQRRVVAETKRTPRSEIKFKNKYHRVKKGENLYLLSKKYGQSIRSLMSLNRLKSKRIYIGQRLKVGKTKVYIVRKGDNLHKIGEKFDVSVATLLRFNSLKSKTIFPRQKIYIPI